MFAVMFHAGKFHPWQEVSNIVATENEATIAKEDEAENDPETTFWVQKVPDDVKVGSKFYPFGFHPPSKAEWKHK